METRDDFYIPFASASPGPTASYGEMADAMHNQMLYVENVNARHISLLESYNRYTDKIDSLTGTRLVNPNNVFNNFMEPDKREKAFEHFESERKRLTLQHPDLADKIQAGKPMEEFAKDMARGTEKHMKEVMARSRGGGMLAGFQGGFTGMLQDPVNLATMMVGGGGRTIWKAALRSAALNATIEGGMQPFVQHWRKEAGLKYGWNHASKNIAAAGLFGFGFDAALRTAGKAVGLNKQNFFLDPAHEDAALHKVVPDLADDNPIKQAYEADGPVRRAVLARAGLDSDELRGAVHEGEAGVAFERLRHERDGVVDTDHIQAMVDNLNHINRPDKYPRPARAPEAVRKPLEKPLEEAAPEGLKTGETFTWYGHPVRKAEFDPEKVDFDARAFQFKKEGADGQGVSDRLKNLEEWDSVAASRVMVFERQDGSQVIADGHQRLALAKRLLERGNEEKITLDGFLYREKDGWTPEELYARAGQRNLKEGSGTVVDSARLIRFRPDVIDDSVPLSSDAMRQSRNLAHLSDEAFGMVVNEVVPANYAAIVGASVADSSHHASVMRELAQLAPSNIEQARFMVADINRDINAGHMNIEIQMDLLGERTEMRSLGRERSQVFGASIKNLKSDKKLYGTLTREAERIEGSGNVLDKDANLSGAQKAAQLEEILARSAHSTGAVSDALTRAAARVSQGIGVKKAADDFTAEIMGIFEKEGLAGLSRTESKVSAGKSHYSEEDLARATADMEQEARLDMNDPEERGVKNYLSKMFGDNRKAQRKVPIGKIGGEGELAGPESWRQQFDDAEWLDGMAAKIEEGC